jgi:hypothetical protein
MAPEVRERFTQAVEEFPETVVAEPCLVLLRSQERAILLLAEKLRAQGLATDGLNILLDWMQSARSNLIH